MYKNILSSPENFLAQALRCTARPRNDGKYVRARTSAESICPLADEQVRSGFLGAVKTEAAFRTPLKILVVLPTPPFRHETSIIVPSAHRTTTRSTIPNSKCIYLFSLSTDAKRQFSTRPPANDYGFFCVKKPRLIRSTS